MVLALCVRVLIKLYLDARLWLLSHWRYWSIWGVSVYLCGKGSMWQGVTKMSRTGMEPSGLASSTVNWMDVSTVLICWKNSSLCDFCELQKYHPHIFSRSLEDSVQCWWHCTQRPPCKYWPQLDLQVTHGSSFSLFKILILEKEICVV